MRVTGPHTSKLLHVRGETVTPPNAPVLKDPSTPIYTYPFLLEYAVGVGLFIFVHTCAHTVGAQSDSSNLRIAGGCGRRLQLEKEGDSEE